MSAIADLIKVACRHYQNGDLQAAERIFLQILQAEPQHGHALYFAGIVQQKLGHPAEAVAYLRQAVQIEPANPAFHSDLGLACAAAGWLDEAIAHYREALRLKPDHADAHNNLGVALAGQGLFLEAADHYRAALRTTPNCAATHVNLGIALAEQGQLQEAEYQYRQALLLQPDYPAAHSHLAGVLTELGRTAEAIACCHEALRIDPDSAAAYAHLGELAAHGFYQFTEGQIGQMQDLLGRCEVRDEGRELSVPRLRDMSRLHFALAALFDRQDRHDQAFAHLQQANHIMREVFRRKNLAFDRTRHRRAIDDTISTFDRGFFERTRSFGADSELPVFVVGMPRSGTTLVAQILSSHPQVVAAGELRDLSEILSGNSQSAHTYPRSMAWLNQQSASALAERYLQRLSLLGGDAIRVLDKMPHNYLHLGSIAVLFPGARIIHCRRSAMDTCLSCFFQNFTWVSYAASLEDLGFYYRQYERLMQHWLAVLPVEMYEVEYETLVGDQERISRELISFCGVAWSDRCLDFHENTQAVSTASKLQVRRPIYSTSIARWKRYERHLLPLQQALTASTSP